MDSRNLPLNPATGETNASKYVVRSQMNAISSPFARVLSHGNFTNSQFRDCRKFFDKFPRPKSTVLSLKISDRYFTEDAFKSLLMWVLMPRIDIYGDLCSGARIFVRIPRGTREAA